MDSKPDKRAGAALKAIGSERSRERDLCYPPYAGLVN